jgi:hypothetical protein
MDKSHNYMALFPPENKSAIVEAREFPRGVPGTSLGITDPDPGSGVATFIL